MSSEKMDLAMAKAELRKKIIDLSCANTWESARLEWRLQSIWISNEPQTCLCGKYPIKEICEIANKKSNNVAEVGNSCVNIFPKLESEKIFGSVRKVSANEEASFNEKAINQAKIQGLISNQDAEFYLDIWRKRNLTDKQLKYKKIINRKIIKGISR